MARKDGNIGARRGRLLDMQGLPGCALLLLTSQTQPLSVVCYGFTSLFPLGVDLSYRRSPNSNTRELTEANRVLREQ
jgi:hypothetical protein